MPRIENVSVERDHCEGALPEWTDALSAHVGRVPPSQRGQELTRSVPIDTQRFRGHIEAGLLGDLVLSRIAATPFHFSRSLRTARPSLPTPVLLIMQVSGTARLVQHDHSCTLRPGDWSLADTLHSFEGWELGAQNEYLVFGLEPPSDAELRSLLEQSVARGFNTKTGLSRVLQSILVEAFKEMNNLSYASGGALQRAITAMVWDALREQLETPVPLQHQDLQRARLKNYIESQLAEPELTIEAIAHACSMSVRSVHRAFAADPSGSISHYMWRRRVNRCAANLRDVGQRYRPITDICMSWGFNSTSHFSRLFKEEFGVSPREYRTASKGASLPQAPVIDRPQAYRHFSA